MTNPAFRLNRRDFLRMMALSGGAAALASCGVKSPTGVPGTPNTPGANASVNVTLKTSGWPIDIAFTDAAPGTFNAGYNKALQAWLDLNPGVTLERIEFNPWDAAGLRTAVAGGTAPFCFPIGVLGGWNVPGIQASNAEGLFADISEAVAKNGVLDKLAPQVAASTSRWKSQDGTYFGIPYEIVSSEGFFYNREHLAEIGMEDIPLTWTWQDMREMALKLTKGDRKGLAMAAYALDWILPSYGIDFDGLLTRYPIPGRSFNWKWDFTTFADDIVEGVDIWRGMLFEDQSVYTDPNFWDFSQNGQLAAAFYEDRAAMTPGIHLFFSDMAGKMNKTILEADKYMSFARQPLGPKGYTYQLPFAVSAWGFNPDLKPVELDKAVSLFTYMLLGDGFVTTTNEIYSANKDASEVIRAIRWPYANKFSENIPGIEGSLNDAAGPYYAKRLQTIFNQPKQPEPGEYTPAEVNRGPGDTPWYDKLTRWAYSQDPFDVKTDAAELENIFNQQAKTFPSGVDENAFAEGIQRYYAEVTTYLQANAPEFYDQRFKPFYDLRIKPNFG
ncbi:MAG: ABC transporter substrate-binding protein [Bellilinea sp.]